MKIKDPVPHIRYVCPYGGHPILRRKARDAYAAVVSFLEICTDWDGTWPDGTITVMPNDKYIQPDERNSKVAAEIALRLGTPKPGITIQQVAFDPDMNVQSSQTAEDWTVSATLHDWAIEQVLEAPAAKRGWPDKISYSAVLKYRLRYPPKGELLRGQSVSDDPYNLNFIYSQIHLSVSSGNTSAFFDLVLPFAQPGPDFVEYISQIRPFLPIRLAKGNFKHYLPNKARDGFVKRRIDASLLAEI